MTLHPLLMCCKNVLGGNSTALYQWVAAAWLLAWHAQHNICRPACTQLVGSVAKMCSSWPTDWCGSDGRYNVHSQPLTGYSGTHGLAATYRMGWQCYCPGSTEDVVQHSATARYMRSPLRHPPCWIPWLRL